MKFQVQQQPHPLEISATEDAIDKAIGYLQTLQHLSKDELLNLCIYLMDMVTDRDAGRRPRNDQEVNQWLVYGADVIKQALHEMQEDETNRPVTN